MKKEKWNLNWYCRNTKDRKRILWTITCQQIWQPRRNGQFSRNIQPTKFNQEEIHNLNRMITRRETESVIKKTSYKQKSRTRWLHRWILPNIQRTYTNPSQTLPRDWRGRNTPKDILWSHHHPDTKTNKTKTLRKNFRLLHFDNCIFDNCSWHPNKI